MLRVFILKRLKTLKKLTTFRLWSAVILKSKCHPLKDRTSATVTERQMHDLTFEICITVQPTFVIQKLEQALKSKEVVEWWPHHGIGVMCDTLLFTPLDT